MKRAIIAACILVMLGVGSYALTFINWSASCPAGETTTVVGWVPITVGKVVTITPIYACEKP